MAIYFGSADSTVNSDTFANVFSVDIDSATNVIYNVATVSSLGGDTVMSDSAGASTTIATGPASSSANNLEPIGGESVAITGGLASYLDTLLANIPSSSGGRWEASYNGYSSAQASEYPARSGATGPNPSGGVDQPIILVSFKNAGGFQIGVSQYFILSTTDTPPVDGNTLVGGGQYDPNIDYAALQNPIDFTSATAVAGAYYYSCFEKNTLIATPAGDRVVSSLAIGDQVIAQDGRAVDIKWIGYQAINSLFARKHDSMPIRIAAGALGDNLPKNDLYVSPDHAFLMDGLLVNASALVNGETISQMEIWAGNVEYYHIETEDHEIILAEGVPAETLLDNSGREKFANYKEFQELYPEGKVTKELDFPRVKFPRQLPEQIKKRLAIICESQSEMAA